MTSVGFVNNLYPLWGTQSSVLPYFFANVGSATNLTAPLTNQQPQPQAQAQALSALRTVWQSFASLSASAMPLDASRFGNVFSNRVATSSNPASVGASATNSATLTSYVIGVSQIAVAQKNVGSQLVSNGTGTFAAGTHTFNLTVAGVSHTLSIKVGTTDTNQTVLTNMATAINSAKSGVTAAVVPSMSGVTRMSQLVVTANTTGTNNTFSVSDATGGSLVAASGIALTTGITAAKNAAYSVNGTSYFSQSNSVTLDAGRVNVNLLAPTTTNATLTVGHDPNAITQAVSSFVQQYNATLSSLRSANGIADPNLANSLTGFAAHHSTGLSNIGVAVNADGTMAVNTTQLSQSIANNLSQVLSLVGGPIGLANSVGTLAKGIASSPATRIANAMWPGIPGSVSVAQTGNGSYSISQQINQYVAQNMMSFLGGHGASSMSFWA